jgi:hypothetical protein
VQQVHLRIYIDPLTFVFWWIVYHVRVDNWVKMFFFINIDIDNLIGILCFFGEKITNWSVIGKKGEKQITQK